MKLELSVESNTIIFKIGELHAGESMSVDKVASKTTGVVFWTG